MSMKDILCVKERNILKSICQRKNSGSYNYLNEVLQDALISMEFSGQEYWSGLPCPPPGLF